MKHFSIIDFKNSARSPLALAILVIVVCLIPNIALSFTENLSLAAALANIVLPLGVYILLMSLTRNVGKSTCWMFPFMFFAAFQIVLLYLFGRSIIAVDMFLNLVTTNPEEVGELLGNMLPIIGVVVLLYLPTLSIGIYMLVKKRLLTMKQVLNLRETAWWVIAIGVATLITSYATIPGYSALISVYPVNVAYNIYLAAERTVKISQYRTTSAGFSFNAHSTHPADAKEIYVAIIGETSRAPQWALMGSDIPTTEPLDTCSGVIPFPLTLSQSNTTHKSVPMLMSATSATNFEDSIYFQKSFITAFKEAGYATTFISNQARNHSFIDYFGEEADRCLFINDSVLNKHRFDTALADELAKVIATDTTRKQLIVLHAYGSHFSYIDRYPNGFGRFKLDRPLDVSGANTTNLVNAYNNTIEYTAYFLSRVIDILKRENCIAAMIYTSDHGEDIYDDNRRLFLHASPMPSYYQIHVPMLIWLSPAYNNAYPRAMKNGLSHKDKTASSSISYFHSLLDIAGIQTPQFIESHSLISPHYTPPRHMYLNDHNRGIPLSEAGLQEEDYQALRKAGFPD